MKRKNLLPIILLFLTLGAGCLTKTSQNSTTVAPKPVAAEVNPAQLVPLVEDYLNTVLTKPKSGGKTTYDIFASYWPNTKEEQEVAIPFNSTKKYVVSHTSFEPAWNNSVCITGEVVAEIKKLKEQDGPDLWVWGSGNLIQTLLENKLIDQMHVWIYPITIGTGKKLFTGGTQAENFKLIDSKIGKNGVICATYEPLGDLTID
jgi:dihydrofolate reductase